MQLLTTTVSMACTMPATIHYADSLDGPWSTAGPITFDYGKGFPPHGGTSNPAPYIFPNGTVIMLSRGKDAGVGQTAVAPRLVSLHRCSLCMRRQGSDQRWRARKPVCH